MFNKCKDKAMSKFGCTCGHIISDSQSPNEVTGWLLSDKSSEIFFDKMISVIDEYVEYKSQNKEVEFRKKNFNDMYPNDMNAGGMIHDVLISYFFSLTLDVLECKNCGNIWMQRNPDENFYLGYSPKGDVKNRKYVLGFNIAQDLKAEDY